MATLPIAATHFSAPLATTHENITDIIESGSNNVTVVQRGGHRFRYAPTLRPINILAEADLADEVEVFLEANATFEIPVFNRQNVLTTGTIEVQSGAAVGDQTVAVQYAAGSTPSLPIGSYVVFTNKPKMYRVQSETRTGGSANATWTLTHPLRQALTTSEDVTYTGVDGKSNAFNGVLGHFANMNFGRQQTVMQDGVVLQFRQMDLIEHI